MKKIALLLLFVSVTTFAQKSINNYKYIIVPKKFDFFKTTDKYRTSSLTRFLFNKYGYKAYFLDDVLPKDLENNRCLALIANVKDDSGMFTTKTFIELNDCNNNVVFTSEKGKSKIKEYKRAYQESIRNAFKSVKRLNYKYQPLAEVAAVKTNNIVSRPKIVIEEKAPETPLNSENVLYAQAKKNGYQLVNTKPEVIFEILNTNVQDVFIIKNKNGILYKNNNTWVAEYYENTTKLTKSYNIKF